ncbi:cytosine permease [Psychrobacillus sp. INOP01]|uniref:cytosine permease n=1 Tax=Psychrobacillus sp. INOP01 TaxID=2829187 RepID=UPI001BA5360F|nr:cytosine permease [Psychrobacillus sp. INOP01]QUG40619.1 cytosine permease [Psychrobacillus sp. INOP01]
MNLKNNDIMPTTDKERDINLIDFVLLWAGMTIGIAGFAVGAQLYPGLSPTSIVQATIVAYVIVTVLLLLNGDIGMKYGLPFTVYMRACFGYKGAHIPGIIRTIPCLFWFGFQTWVGALALHEIVKIFLGHSNLTILIILFAAVQIFNAIYGMKAMAKFDYLAIPALTIVLGVTVIWLLKNNNATMTDIFAISGNGSTAFSFAIMGVAGGWITMALNSPDLTRKLKRSKNYEDNTNFWNTNKRALFGQTIGLVLVGSLVIMVGMIAGVLTGVWNPIDVLVSAFAESNVWILIIAFITIIFAQWSTNIAANLMPPAYIIINMFPKLNFKWGIIISGIIGILILPWKFSDYLVQFQVITSGLLGPICGIMIADYYLVRKRKLNIEDFYQYGGAFTYQKDFNLIAVISLVLSFAIGCIFPDYIFFISFLLSILIYTPFMKRKVV